VKVNLFFDKLSNGKLLTLKTGPPYHINCSPRQPGQWSFWVIFKTTSFWNESTNFI